MKIIMDEEGLEEFIYEFHEKVLELTPERRVQLKAVILQESHRPKFPLNNKQPLSVFQIIFK